MKLLADENVDHPVVDWLRQSGHEVSWMVERESGASDASIAALAILAALPHYIRSRLRISRLSPGPSTARCALCPATCAVCGGPRPRIPASLASSRISIGGEFHRDGAR